MSRPENVSDLDAYTLRGQQSASAVIDSFRDQPDMVVAWGKFMQAATAAGHAVIDGSVYRTPDATELEEALARAQKVWDANEEAYEAALGGAPEPKYTYALKEWCRKEGHDYPYADTEETR